MLIALEKLLCPVNQGAFVFQNTLRVSISLPIGYVAAGLLYSPTNGNLNYHLMRP